MSTAVTYQVAWRFSDDDEARARHDDVQATTAPRAMSKVFKSLAQEYAITRRDVEFLEVYRI